MYNIHIHGIFYNGSDFFDIPLINISFARLGEKYATALIFLGNVLYNVVMF